LGSYFDHLTTENAEAEAKKYANLAGSIPVPGVVPGTPRWLLVER
jgi:hypothetical protein